MDTIPRLAKITKSKVIFLKINRGFNDYYIDFIKFDDFPSDSIKNDLIKINKVIESIVSKNHITITGFTEDLKHGLTIMKILLISNYPLKFQEINELINLSFDVWRKTYPGIISYAQIITMLSNRYTYRKIKDEINKKKVFG